MSVTPVIALVAEKGGVGKTTTAANIAAWLGREKPGAAGLRVLAIDTDTQGHLALALGALPPTDDELTLALAYVAAAQGVDLSQLRGMKLAETRTPGVTLLRGGEGLIEQRDTIYGAGADGEEWLGEIAAAFAPDFDAIVIDTPPTVGPMLLGALRAADLGLVVLKGDDPYSLPALHALRRHAEELDGAGPELALVAQAVIARRQVFQAIDGAIESEGATWLARVPHSVTLQHAALKGEPLVIGPRSGSAAGSALRDLADEAYELARTYAQEAR